MTILLFILNLMTFTQDSSDVTSLRSGSSDSLYVSQILITGNNRTRESIIRRELTFETGSRLPLARLEAEVERSRRNIFNTQLFIHVAADYDVVGNEAAVVIEVKERLYLLPLPILNLADRSFNEWWYTRNRDLSRLIYGIQLSHSNLSGNSDFLKAKIYGGFIPYLELTYGRPYIDRRQRMGIRGGVFYSEQKSFAFRTWSDRLDFLESESRSFSRRGAFLEYNLRNALYHFNTLYLGFTNSSVADTIPLLNPNYFGEGNTSLNFATFSYDYKFDKRDNRQYPLDGKLLTAGLKFFHTFDKNLRNHARLNLSMQSFFPIGGKFYSSLGIKMQASLPGKQLYPFVMGLGFRNNFIRGYELNVIDGQHYMVGQADVKYQLLNRTFNLDSFLRIKQFNTLPIGGYLTAFFDLGAIRNYYPELSNSTLSNRLLVGGGLGLDIVTFYDTSVKINYSVNQFGLGKLYFGVFRE